MENYEKFKLNEDAQKKLEKHGFKHIFDEERELYSIVSINPNKDGKIDYIFNYDIEDGEYFTYLLNVQVEDLIASNKIINNFENNSNYNDYDITLNLDHDGFYVALNKEDEINKDKQFAILVESNVVDEDVDLTIRNRAFNVKHFDVDTIFSDIKDPSEFLNYNEVERDYDLSIEDYPYYSHRTNITSYLKPNNEQRVSLKDEAYCIHEMKFSDLENTDFLAKPLELFNEKSIVEKYNDILENPKEQDIVNMLIEEKVIDSEKYNKLREENKEQEFINAVSSVNNKEQDQGLIR